MILSLTMQFKARRLESFPNGAMSNVLFGVISLDVQLDEEATWL